MVLTASDSSKTPYRQPRFCDFALFGRRVKGGGQSGSLILRVQVHFV